MNNADADADPDKERPDSDTKLDETTNTTAKTKKQVVADCLPQINALLISKYGRIARPYFFFRSSTQHTGTTEAPVVILYTTAGLPLEFSMRTASGLGTTVADAIANLNAMAESPVIQAQFVAREDDAPGFRVHVGFEPANVGIPAANPGIAPVSPSDSLIIYDTEGIAAANVNVPEVVADDNPGDDVLSGWYDCNVDETTQQVTVWFTKAITTL